MIDLFAFDRIEIPTWGAIAIVFVLWGLTSGPSSLRSSWLAIALSRVSSRFSRFRRRALFGRKKLALAMSKDSRLMLIASTKEARTRAQANQAMLLALAQLALLLLIQMAGTISGRTVAPLAIYIAVLLLVSAMMVVAMIQTGRASETGGAIERAEQILRRKLSRKSAERP